MLHEFSTSRLETRDELNAKALPIIGMTKLFRAAQTFRCSQHTANQSFDICHRLIQDVRKITSILLLIPIAKFAVMRV
jgi:hypothetical protein